METKDKILSLLGEIIHPEYSKDIVSLEMIELGNITEKSITVTVKLLKARDPFVASLKKSIERKISEAMPAFTDGINIIIREPAPASKPKPAPINPERRLPGVNKIIAVASGKGGVGKSTVTANMAVTMAKMGYKVGVVDADIYGPSMPKMFGVEGYTPTGVGEEGQELLVPAESYGVKIMSIGFFIKSTDALVWRGPMATSALKQIIGGTAWGELDFLLIDLPPGTGDVHLTIIQELQLDGAVVVSTPQQVALADVVRGISMFRSENVAVPVLGIVENMAWFTPEELPENKYYIFGKEGCKTLAKQEGLPLLAQIPIVMSVCSAGDEGRPASLDNSIVHAAFDTLVKGVVSSLKTKN